MKFLRIVGMLYLVVPLLCVGSLSGMNRKVKAGNEQSSATLLINKQRLFPALQNFKHKIDQLIIINNGVSEGKLPPNTIIDVALRQELTVIIDEIIELTMNISGQKQFDDSMFNEKGKRLETYLQHPELVASATPTICLERSLSFLKAGLNVMKQCDPNEKREVNKIINDIAKAISERTYTNLKDFVVRNAEQEPKSTTSTATVATLRSNGIISGQAVLSDQASAATAATAGPATSHQNSASKKTESSTKRSERARAETGQPAINTATQVTLSEQAPSAAKAVQDDQFKKKAQVTEDAQTKAKKEREQFVEEVIKDNTQRAMSFYEKAVEELTNHHKKNEEKLKQEKEKLAEQVWQKFIADQKKTVKTKKDKESHNYARKIAEKHPVIGNERKVTYINTIMRWDKLNRVLSKFDKKERFNTWKQFVREKKEARAIFDTHQGELKNRHTLKNGLQAWKTAYLEKVQEAKNMQRAEDFAAKNAKKREEKKVTDTFAALHQNAVNEKKWKTDAEQKADKFAEKQTLKRQDKAVRIAFSAWQKHTQTEKKDEEIRLQKFQKERNNKQKNRALAKLKNASEHVRQDCGQALYNAYKHVQDLKMHGKALACEYEFAWSDLYQATQRFMYYYAQIGYSAKRLEEMLKQQDIKCAAIDSATKQTTSCAEFKSKEGLQSRVTWQLMRDVHGILHNELNFPWETPEFMIKRLYDLYGTQKLSSNEKTTHALLDATRAHNVVRVRGLLDSKADINGQNDKKQTALHVAVAHKQPWLTALLLAKDADVNVRNVNGVSPWNLYPVSNASMMKVMDDNCKRKSLSNLAPKPALASNDDHVAAATPSNGRTHSALAATAARANVAGAAPAARRGPPPGFSGLKFAAGYSLAQFARQ